MRAFLCLVVFICVSCSTIEIPSEPSPRFGKAAEIALHHGFRLEDHRGRTAKITTSPSNQWLQQLQGAPAPIQTFRLQLSNSHFSDVVDMEEWVFSSPKDAEEIIREFEAQKTRLSEFKLLYKLWSEDSRVYFVSTRAFMFEGELEKVASLLKQ